MKRAAVVFPGRGAYTPAATGSLLASHRWVRRADQLRLEYGLPALTALDGAAAFEPAVHLRPSNAMPLTFIASLLDADRIAADHDVVVVIASSTGWYTALAASGVLRFDDAFRLVQEMALAADVELPGGAAEVVYPLVDDRWEPDPRLSSGLSDAVANLNGGVHRALDLGAYAVIAGTRDGIGQVAERLPPVTVAGRAYPLRLAPADAWHTPLRAAAIATAVERLAGLRWERPGVALVDGRGARFSPWSSDPRALAEYTLQVHPQARYDFATALRVALREYAPDSIVLAGPGQTLGAPCAQIAVAEGYRGMRSRAAFESAQGGDSPLLLSVRR